jgi:hypothetical protein
MDADEPIKALESDCIVLSDELSILWRQFCQLFRCRPEIRSLLAAEHHVLRVRCVFLLITIC